MGTFLLSPHGDIINVARQRNFLEKFPRVVEKFLTEFQSKFDSCIYPAGTDSSLLLPSITPNRGRFRCASAGTASRVGSHFIPARTDANSLHAGKKTTWS